MSTQHVDYVTIPMSELIEICTDQNPIARWTVHQAPAPEGTLPPFVALSYDTPRARGRSAAVESWGRIDPTIRVACFGVSQTQADWLRARLLENGWPQGWHPGGFAPLVLDDTAAPPWWISTLFMEHEPA